MATKEEIDIFTRVSQRIEQQDASPSDFAKRAYIRELNEGLYEIALYGPFSDEEVGGLLNDAFADAMASGGADIEEVRLTDEDASKHYINPREFWMRQLATLTE